MRNDMNKVIGDVYRHGSGIITKTGRPPRDLDAMPSREGMRTPYKGGWGSGMKESSYNGSPVRRYLDKQVGRPWNAVYSEICRTYDARKPANRTIFELVERFVTTKNLVVIDGEVRETSAYGDPFPPVGLYAHPVTGILMRAEIASMRMLRNVACKEAEERRRKEKEANERTLSETLKAMKLNGHWFLVEMAPVTAPRMAKTGEWKDSYGKVHQHEWLDPDSLCCDVLTGTEFTAGYIKLYPHIKVYAKSKRQASHRELKQYGLL